MLKTLEKSDLEHFKKWKKEHMPMYEELKKKFYCAANDEEIDEVMTYLYLFGAEDYDDLMKMDDLK